MSDEREGEKCGNCRWWQRPENTKLIDGECRRFPPVILQCMIPKEARAFASDFAGYFPETGEDWFCGEHQPKHTPCP